MQYLYNVKFWFLFQTAVTRGVRACVSLFHLQSILVSNATRLLCGNNNSGLNGDAYSDNTAADSDLLALPGKYLFLTIVRLRSQTDQRLDEST